MKRNFSRLGFWAFAIGLSLAGAAHAQGVSLTGIGPTNRAMEGAATACPLDAEGALYWNPASITGLPNSEVSGGMSLVLPSARVSSQIPAGSLGHGFPPVTLSGSERSESGATPVPYLAFVKKTPESPWTYGLGLFGIGGFSLNYPSSYTDPILTPQAPNGVGLGRIASSLQIMQIVPTVAYALTPNLSIGAAPTVTLAKFNADPFPFASPDDANGDGNPSYPSGSGSRFSWGGGFQLGVYYTTDTDWHFGAALKSTQWIEEFRFKSADEQGFPRTLTFDLDYPMILTLGTAYSGFEDWVLACDVRYFNYSHTAGFKETGFDATGAVKGLGWQSVWALNTGVQRRITDQLFLRMGYSFNGNPIPDSAAIFNVESPLVYQHVLHVGMSYQFADNWIFSMGYGHAFQGEITGPYVTPRGAIPGASISSELSVDVIDAGITVRF